MCLHACVYACVCVPTFLCFSFKLEVPRQVEKKERENGGKFKPWAAIVDTKEVKLSVFGSWSEIVSLCPECSVAWTQVQH